MSLTEIQRKELTEIAQLTCNAYWKAATSDDPRIAFTQFKNYPPTAYSILKKAFLAILTQLCDGNRDHAKMIFSIFLNCNESVEWCYNVCEEAKWRKSAFYSVSWES